MARVLRIPRNRSSHHFYMFSFPDGRKAHNRLQWIGETQKMAGTSGNSFNGSYRVHFPPETQPLSPGDSAPPAPETEPLPPGDLAVVSGFSLCVWSNQRTIPIPIWFVTQRNIYQSWILTRRDGTCCPDSDRLLVAQFLDSRVVAAALLTGAVLKGRGPSQGRLRQNSQNPAQKSGRSHNPPTQRPPRRTCLLFLANSASPWTLLEILLQCCHHTLRTRWFSWRR